ncbi:MAG: 23S rRNA (adenine(2503)-C(2))-methyltransferase RlmN [Eubacteriales bacterium]|nr:23S rRNA (adenine(2503)-C(2))-methyltransferase RlmN [Eubacteriales bacterium]
MDNKRDLLDMELNQMKEFMLELGSKPYHAAQIMKWIYSGVTDFNQMTDLSKELRTELTEHAVVGTLQLKNVSESKIDGTVKCLFEVQGGDSIESVLMEYTYGMAACISSQVGCRMGCAFCASSGAAFSRNLSAGEMMEQVLQLGRIIGKRIGNIVIMGIGEPFDNYDNLIRFLKIIGSKESLNIGYRHITISTCGLAPGIIKLANEGIPVNLSISLHAPNDSIRSKIMPINRKYAIDKVIETCKIYLTETKRRITFEYILIDGLNDSEQHAAELSGLLKGLMCHVNLIPYNEVEGVLFRTSPQHNVNQFKAILETAGITATVRRRLGDDIEAACGQLRRRKLKDGEW